MLTLQRSERNKVGYHDLISRVLVKHSDLEAHRCSAALLLLAREHAHQLVGRVRELMAVREEAVALLSQRHLIVKQLQKHIKISKSARRLQSINPEGEWLVG